MYGLRACCYVGHSDRSPETCRLQTRNISQIATVCAHSIWRCFKTDISESQPSTLRTQKLGLSSVPIISLSFFPVSRKIKFLGSLRLKFSSNFGTFQPFFLQIVFSAIYSFSLLLNHTPWYCPSLRLCPFLHSSSVLQVVKLPLPVFQVHWSSVVYSLLLLSPSNEI